MSIRRRLGASAATAVLALCVWPSPAGAQARPRATCTACIVVDDTGRTLWARSPDLQLPNASTTKMVTALVAVQEGVGDDLVTVSRAAAATGQGGFDLHPGETYAGHDLLYALLLTSSNDAAVALAEHVAGSESAFVGEMNALVAELGTADTSFATSHGLDTAGHYSTAADLVLIAASVLDDDTLAPIVATAEARIDTPGGSAIIDEKSEPRFRPSSFAAMNDAL